MLKSKVEQVFSKKSATQLKPFKGYRNAPTVRFGPCGNLGKLDARALDSMTSQVQLQQKSSLRISQSFETMIELATTKSVNWRKLPSTHKVRLHIYAGTQATSVPTCACLIMRRPLQYQ
jgi:hypothetical protein